MLQQSLCSGSRISRKMVSRRLSFPHDAFVRETFLRCLGSQIFREIDGFVWWLRLPCFFFRGFVGRISRETPLSGFGGQISLETALVVLGVSREPPFFGGLAA